MKKYTAEALGAFALTFIVLLSIAGTFPVPTAVLAALTLGLFVYTIGPISGSHINPAVTIGLWSIKKIDGMEALKYIITQFIGAGVALFLFSLTHPASSNNITVINSSLIGGAELIGAFFFGFGIASVVYDKTPAYLSGVVIGGSLLLGISMAALLGSNGILNPAVAFGIGSFNVMYLLGPIIGSILGMQTYKYLESLER
jgi:glycerol uptake facilitator-like aquaporin